MKTAVNFVYLSLVMFLVSPMAYAGTNSELEAQVALLNERVRMLEEKLDVVLARSDKSGDQVMKAVVTSNASEGAGLAKFSIGGRVKVDVIGNSVSVGGEGGKNRADSILSLKSIPLQDAGEDNQFTSSARDSRIWLHAATPTDLGDLSAYLEFDFGSQDNSGTERVSNSYNPRIRHAYATFRNLTIGQTYTTFLNSLAYPELNDVSGPVGILNIRQPMIRYSRSSERLRWSIAAEQPETTVLDAAGISVAFDDDRTPDLIGRLDWRVEAGDWSVAAIVRQIRMDDLLEDEIAGYGISASGRLFTNGANNIRFSLTYGEGVGRYIAYNAFDDAQVDSGNELVAIPVASGFLAYQHWWSDRWRSNLAVGYGEADIDTRLVSSAVNESYTSAHLNLLWSPIPSATFGIEWLHGERELTDGRSATLNRLQFTSLYRFGH